MKILVAEDEVQMNRVLETALAHAGFEVDTVFDGQAALEQVEKNDYDVLVVDIMMPKKTGIEVVKEVRGLGYQMHIIMLTAMAEVDDRVTGLDAGADDYLSKPFSLKELLARLRSMERRVDEAVTTKLLTAGSVSLNIAEQEMRSQNAIRLASKEAKMMELLMRNVGRQLSTEHIFKRVWNEQESEQFDESDVYMYISYLRKKLEAIGANLVISGEEGGHYVLDKV
ncbi:response regulator transcription factor [Tuanshanicoccus lijuaniae]|uniref:response regulator transcription factor n=1 Tax=Aerococcaceae bacterium zg-1292 TaxID=2774330 RepID=UPI001BD8F9A4|nr:response regulator transcription factor [Aerococcaceae bacterium zg-BR22]MBS4455338.1 response regulator transcription factor [Aerococcaceae bacterium zg-A91]MBS4457298.1 response regulator transcription factor [Aerococcaceae bacterium zg-BR33]